MNPKSALLLASVLFACSSGQHAPRSAPAPRPVSVVFENGEILAYRITDPSGVVLGRTRGEFSRVDGELQLVTRLEIDTRRDGGFETAEHATRLGPGFEPRLYKRLSSSRGRFEIQFSAGGLSVHSERGQSEVRREPVRAPVYFPEDMMLLALLIHRSAVMPGGSEVLDVFAPDAQSSELLSFRMWAEADGRLMVEMPAGRAELDERWHVRRFESREHGLIFELEQRPGDPIELTLQDRKRYLRPDSADWEDREFVVAVRDGSLSGVVSIPRRRAGWDKKLAPPVVFISDRGPQDRYGQAGDVDRGTWALQDKLAEGGFIVLRLDDRGAGPEGPPAPREGESLERSDDFGRALEAVLRLPEADHQRAVLVGHGEGALIAARLAFEQEVAALVLVAPRYRGLEAEWKTAIAGLNKPVLILQGLADFEVSWKDEADVLSKLITAKVGKNRMKLAAFDRVDHLMKEEPKTSSIERYRDGSRLIDTRVLDAFAAWVRQAVPGL